MQEQIPGQPIDENGSVNSELDSTSQSLVASSGWVEHLGTTIDRSLEACHSDDACSELNLSPETNEKNKQRRR